MQHSVSGLTSSTAGIGVRRIAPSMSLRKAASLLTGPITQRLGFSSVHPLLSSTSACTTTTRRRISTTVFAAQDGRLEGTVKWFNPTKGYGFIVPADGTPDLFVHQTSINSEGFRSLAEGETVEYDVGADNNGRPRAVNVTGPNGQQVVGTPRQSYGEPAGRGGGGGGRGRRDSYGGGYNDGGLNF